MLPVMLDDARVRDSTEPLRVTYDEVANAAYIYLVPEIERGGVGARRE
jgi:hypothetical protein